MKKGKESRERRKPKARTLTKNDMMRMGESKTNRKKGEAVTDAQKNRIEKEPDKEKERMSRTGQDVKMMK